MVLPVLARQACMGEPIHGLQDGCPSRAAGIRLALAKEDGKV